MIVNPLKKTSHREIIVMMETELQNYAKEAGSVKLSS